MKRILKMLRGNRRSRQPRQSSGTPVFERLEPRLLLNAVPYMQDFSLGKPGGADGWEYYSDNEGRIEVVNERLRMDDTVGNGTYSLNESILHVDLSGKTGVTLTLDHWSLWDESNTLPSSFVGRYKADGIALSVDGQHWVKVTDLTVNFTNQSFDLDPVLQQAQAAAGSSDLSDVRIKFQQYDNYPAFSDGREFDNIRITSTLPEIQVLGNGQIIADGDTTPNSNDDTDFGSVPQGSSVVRTFTIRSTGAAALNLTGVPKVQWTGSTDFTVVRQPGSPVAPNGGTTTFQIQFSPSGPGLKTATVQVANDDGDENPYDFVIQGIGSSSPGPQILLSEDFNDGNYNGWQLVDQGTIGSMAWSAATGVMVQSSNVHSLPAGNELPKLGTYAYWQAGTGWTDYTTEVTIKSDDNDSIGVMFRYQDENNYYRFSWDRQRSSRRLVKCVAGQFTLLAEDSVPYVIGQNYELKIVAHGTTLQVSIDGSSVFSVNDSSLSSGTIALYNWGNMGSYFDDIVVESAFVNQAPIISSVTATPSTISDEETSQLQVNATDPDNGPSALTYSWSVQPGQGSLSDASIANPVYTPPNVSATQTFTLTVKVFDGVDITSKTVDITVTDAAPPGPQILLSEDFDDGNYNGWQLVDQGTIGSMAWSAATGVMVQSSNVHSLPAGNELPKLGTYAYWQAGTGWTDYTTEVTIKSDDNDSIGVMFRYQDENNYYRFSWDRQRSSRRLVKCVAGQFTLLAEDSVPYVIGQNYELKIVAHGTTLQVSIDGSSVFSVNDSSLSSGTIALYNWGNMGSYFDDIVVESAFVNQAPIISSVTATPSTISDEETSQLQVNATDPDNGPSALTYSWSVQPGQGSLSDASIANPVYTPPNVSATQTFTLTVKVFDGVDITSKTVDITVTDAAPPGPQILLSEDFDDGNYNGWQLVDQGTVNGPMAWSAATGTMVQSSNVYSLPTGNELPKLGTYAYWQAGTGWTDYTTAVTIKSDDNDSIGVMFRYQDENNYYRFSWDRQRSFRRLVKCVAGQFTLLAEDSVPYVIGQNYELKIVAHGTTLQVSIDGSSVFSVNDSSLSSGTIALYNWGNIGSYFDDVVVESAFVNQAPIISSVTATPSTISDEETSQLQVNATDPDNGPGALTYSWAVQPGQGNLSDASIANPIYTPPNVSATQTFTLTVKVFDGVDITSKTVDITVTDAAPPGPQILLSEDFDDGNYNGWQLVDQGTIGSMAWSAATGVMVQSSNVHSLPAGNELPKLGTYAYWQAGTGWTDYTTAVTIKSDDNDSIGVMFRYQDENNYYRFSWDRQRSFRRLVKCVAGQFTLLAEDSVPYVMGQNYQLKIVADGTTLQVSIDGSSVFSVNDSSLSSGTIALYNWGNMGSYFDDIVVESAISG